MAEDVVYIDFNEGVKRVMNNAKLYIKLLAKFKTDANFEELSASLAAGDLEKAKGQAHTIKGIAANLSLTELYKQVLELENQIKAQAVDPNQVEIVKTVFEATVQNVDRVMAENG